MPPTLDKLPAALGLIVTLTVAVVVTTFRSLRLAGVALVTAGLSAGPSMPALGVFGYTFGVRTIVGPIGSLGVGIDAALIIMTVLQEDEAATAGDPDVMAGVVMASSRHIVSTTITTLGGFPLLILAGGGFRPPFAMAAAGACRSRPSCAPASPPPAFRLAAPRPAREASPALAAAA